MAVHRPGRDRVVHPAAFRAEWAGGSGLTNGFSQIREAAKKKVGSRGCAEKDSPASAGSRITSLRIEIRFAEERYIGPARNLRASARTNLLLRAFA